MSTDADELEDDINNKMDVSSSDYSSHSEETTSDPDWEILENNAENEDSSRNEEASGTKVSQNRIRYSNNNNILS